ncbi:MAG: MBL fold metallo-hydrolase [Gammaproteobacteria bacterium]|nr:MBL fold metallo-hydrolase [Gammaproteobacteria bacterium]
MRKTVLALSLFVAFSTHAQMENITYESTEVAPGFYMTVGNNPDGPFGGGTSGFIVTADYVALIDDGLLPPASAMVAHITELAGKAPDFLVNTHYHGDHTGANALFADEGTVVFAHHALRERLLENPDSAGGDAGIPVVTFGEGVTFHMNDVEAQVVHLPAAHTDGDAIVVAKNANVIFAGDIVFNKIFPFIDLDGGGSVDGFISAQRKIVEMADEKTVIIPGHGELASLESMRKNIAMLVDGQKRVNKLVEAGMSEDEAVAANPLADFATTFDWYFIDAERMTRTFYKDLSGK